jgi:tripartite-type tricarboxylate transporter receptor subunit TctC
MKKMSDFENRRRAIGALGAWGALGGAAALLPGAAWGQSFPSKPMRVIVAFPPGASNDLMGRIIASEMSKGFAPNSVVENRPGGGTVIATDLVVKAPPDGHTLLIVSFPFPLINSLYPGSRIDVTRDLLPIATLTTTPNALVVRADSPFKTLRDLIAFAKANPGKLSYASTGNGSSPHLGAELLKRLTGTFSVHIPYRGSAPAVTDLLGGLVDFMFDNLPNSVPHAKAGRMRVLAVTSAKRSPSMPDVPTMAEAGVPGFVMDVWIGLVTARGAPPTAIAALNRETNRILALPDVRTRLEGLGMEIRGGTPEAFGQLVAADVAKWARVVREANIKVE